MTSFTLCRNKQVQSTSSLALWTVEEQASYSWILTLSIKFDVLLTLYIHIQVLTSTKLNNMRYKLLKNIAAHCKWIRIPYVILFIFYRCTIDLSLLEKEKTHELWQDLEYGYGSIHLLVTLSATGRICNVDNVPTTINVQHASLPKEDFVSTNLFVHQIPFLLVKLIRRFSWEERVKKNIVGCFCFSLSFIII